MKQQGRERIIRSCLMAALLVVPVFCAARPSQAAVIKLATWNLSWLTLRPPGDPLLPPDVKPRETADFERLAAYARHLDADIVGIEEVDGIAAAQRLFPSADYTVLTTGDPVVQQVGIAVRKPLSVAINPELRTLDVSAPDAAHHLRGGLDVTISDGHAALRVLVVHLKTGCWDDPLTTRDHSCPTLRQQFAILADWILERQDEGEAYAVIGDINRRLTNDDEFMHVLAPQPTLTLTTAGHASPCWGGEYFIDHIMLGNAARNWLVPDSLRVMTYSEHDEGLKPRLSDHCPVSVRLAIP